MAAGVGAVGEAFALGTAHVMVAGQQDDQGELGMQPPLAQPAGGEVQHPGAKHVGGDHRRVHDAAVQLALHGHEAFLADAVLALGVVDEQPRQVEQAGEPADHADDMQRFDP
ncbi:hypothetical protein D3C75_877820 [compost metagenome]